MPYRPKPARRSIRGAQARGYTRQWQERVRQVIAAEPWCHTEDCPYPDCTTPANPLVGDHPTSMAAGGSTEQWPVPRCRRSNSAKG